MIGVPVKRHHVGAILLCFLCRLSLEGIYFGLGGSLPQPPFLRGEISLRHVKSKDGVLSVRSLLLVCSWAKGLESIACYVRLSMKIINAELNSEDK